MPGLNHSADAGVKKKRQKKERSGATVSNLSAEFVVDSDSDGELETAKEASKAVAPKEAKSAHPKNKAAIASSRATATPKASIPRKLLVEESKARSVRSDKVEETGDIKQGKSQGDQIKNVYRNSIAEKATAPGRPDIKSSLVSQRKSLPDPVVHRTPRNDSSTEDEDNQTDEDTSSDRYSKSTGQKRTNGATPSKPNKQDSKLVTPQILPSKRARSLSKESSESVESGDSDDNNTEESESTNSEPTKQVKQKSAQQTSKLTKPTKSTALNYKAPPGFSLATVLSPASELATIFSPSNLSSKQLWHITLPTSVPVHAIEEVSMDSLLRDTALTYNNTDYNFVSDPKGEQLSKHILLPDKEHNDYRAAPRLVSRTLHLRQILQLSELSNPPRDDTGRTQTTSESGKVVHEQPAGLKMRYRPFGDESPQPGSPQPESPQPQRAAIDTINESCEGPRSKVAQFRVPPTLESLQRKQKRKLEIPLASNEATPGTPAKKRHKKRHVEPDAKSVAKTQIDEGKHAATHVKPDFHDTLEGSATNRDKKKHSEETPDERTNRKAEKRKRRKERRGEDVLEESNKNGNKEKRKPNGLGQDEGISEDTVTKVSQEKHNEDEMDTKAKRKAEKAKRRSHADDIEDSGTNAIDREHKGQPSERRAERGAEKTTRQEDNKEFPAVSQTGSKDDSDSSEERANRKAERRKRKVEKEKRAQARDSGSLAVAAAQ